MNDLDMSFTLLPPKWAGISRPSHFATWEGLQPTRHQSLLHPAPAEANLNTAFHISQLFCASFAPRIWSHRSQLCWRFDPLQLRRATWYPNCSRDCGTILQENASQQHPNGYLMIWHTSIHPPIPGSTFTCTCQWKTKQRKGAATAAVLHLRLLQPHLSGFADSMQQREPRCLEISLLALTRPLTINPFLNSAKPIQDIQEPST